MKITSINYTSKFAKNFKKLTKDNRIKALKKIAVFKNDTNEVSLKTHKLSGKLNGYYSFRIDYSYRILFVFENSSEVTFLDIGTHSIY